MIVLDASVVVQLLINGELADGLRRDMEQRIDSFIVPHLLDIEVASALRRMVSGRRIDGYYMDQLLGELAALPAERYAHIPMLPRMWELRHKFTCYDAAYVALAEMTDSLLYTCDGKLKKGPRARVKVFGG